LLIAGPFIFNYSSFMLDKPEIYWWLNQEKEKGVGETGNASSRVLCLLCNVDGIQSTAIYT
jgi:hypothetical protein